MITAKISAACPMTSRRRASSRVGRPAVSKPSTTASGVTSRVATARRYRWPAVDIDRFLLANEATWQRLATLTSRAGRSAGRLAAAELDAREKGLV